MRFSSAVLLALTLVAASCGRSHRSLSESSIYGGSPVAVGDRIAAIGITEQGSTFCSGTAVAPTIVITAAHCVVDDAAENMKVYVGNGVEGGNFDGQYDVEKIAYNPKYDVKSGEGGYDVAYLKLKTPLDLPKSAYTTMLTDPIEMAELLRGGTPSYLVGFGQRKKHKVGVKYEVKAQVRRLTGVEVTLGGNGRDGCQGDSGGPAYGQLKTGEWRVYGVTSRGGDCGNGGIWGLMYASACWVQDDSGVDLGLPAGYCQGAELAQEIKVKFGKAKN